MIIIGLDPGLRHTGWGIIEAVDNRLRWIADGVVSPIIEDLMAYRLAELYRGIEAIIKEYQPNEAAVEETFVNRNPASALKLGQARGVILAVAALSGMPVAEYSAKMVKKTIVGTGQAEKEQVSMMVRRLLPGCMVQKADAADALGIAISHAHLRSYQNKVKRALETHK